MRVPAHEKTRLEMQAWGHWVVGMNVDLSEVFFTKELQPPFFRQK